MQIIGFSFSVALDFIHGVITLRQLFPIIPFNIQADGNNHSNCIFHTLANLIAVPMTSGGKHLTEFVPQRAKVN